MVPTENGFNQSDTCAHCDVFQAGLPLQGMAQSFTKPAFLSSQRHNFNPKSGYVATKLHGTSTC